MERKGFGIRLLAWLIDIIIVGVIGGVIGVIVGAGFVFSFGGGLGGGGGTGPTPEQVRAAVIAGLLGNLVALAYTSTEIFMAASPGKMLLKLKIRDQSGAEAPRNQLIARWATKWSPNLIGLLAAIPGLGFVSWIANLAGLAIFVGCFFTLGAARQALHDMLAKTAVFGASTAYAAGFQPVMPGQDAPPPPRM